MIRLALGAAAGLLLAALNLLGKPGSSAIGPGAVAMVNGKVLDSSEYQRAVRLFASEKREAVKQSDRSLILRRMIEEELLLQYALSAGLVRRNQAVRMEALQSVVAGLTVELEARSAELDERSGTRAGDEEFGAYVRRLRQGADIQWAVRAGQP